MYISFYKRNSTGTWCSSDLPIATLPATHGHWKKMTGHHHSAY